MSNSRQEDDMAAGAQLATQTRSEILATVETMFDAWNRHDMAMHTSAFANDADFVNVLGLYWHGRAEIEARHVELHRKIYRDSSMKLLNCGLRLIAPNVVLAQIHWEMTGHETPPFAPFAPVRQGLTTAVFVQRDGRWSIVSSHNTDIVSASLPELNP
jgi:uncharacterized protein (TIGR02246 family)